MPTEHLDHFIIKIDGSAVPDDFMTALIEVVVDSSLYLPEMFTILLEDSQLKWVDDALLNLGKAVEISVQTSEGPREAPAESAPVVLMQGEITGLEPDFSSTDGQTRLLVRGYNKSHRLHRGKKSRTFANVTDSDIVSKIAGEAGLTAEVDATSVIHDFVLQNNQTNMEFLMSRAERLGYIVFAAEGKLYFKKGNATLGSGPTIKLGDDLRSFRPILASTHQADTIEVRGWDPGKKEAIVGQAKPALMQGGQTKTGGAEAKSAFAGAATLTVVDQVIARQGEADALATGLAQDLDRDFIEAEGLAVGHPKIKAGYTLTIGGVGNRFSGTYFVTSALHLYKKAGYETRFTISGRQPTTLTSLVDSGNGSGRGLMHGLAIGIVTNNKSDKKYKGYSVKVKYPWLDGGKEVESDWIRLAAPGGGKERGMLWMPEVNDEVLLGFEHGDIHHPYILGGLWNDKDTFLTKLKNTENTDVDIVGSDGKVNCRVFQSRAGHLIVLDDELKKEQIFIKTKAGHSMLLDDSSGSEKMEFKDKSGNNSVLIDTVKNAITINAAQNLTIKCGQKLTLECTDLAVTAKASGSIKANTTLTLEGTGKSEVKGAQVSVNGSAQTEVKGGAMVMIQGGLVKIN